MAKVYVDAGHGGSDAGAVKYVTEKTVNLTEALACRDYLEANGIEVKMSRTGDTSTSINSIAKAANNWGADYVVSIHNNAGGGVGFEVYHTVNGGKGKTLAQNIEKEVKAIGQTSRGLKTKKNASGQDYFGMIRLTNAPCVICEGCFVDNASDVEKINTTEKQQTFGIAYAKGILATIGAADNGGSASTAETKTETKSGNVVTVDGIWGTGTTKYTQKHLGTTADGIVSGQLTSCKKYLSAAHTGSWKFSSKGGGSAMVKALQKLIGATQDGLMGKASVKALQTFLQNKGYSVGASGIDGYMGTDTAKAWQSYINSQF